MALRAALLDLDGTLLDTNLLHARAWQEAFAGRGIHLPEARIAKEIGLGGKVLVTKLAGAEVEDDCGEALREAHGEAYLRLVEEEGVDVFPEAEALLKTLRARGLKTAVATGSKRESLETVLEEAGLDLDALTDALVTSSDVEKSKPEPDTVGAAAEKLGVAPAECVMVGDTPYDAMSARRAGAVTLGVRTGVHPHDALHRAGARASFQSVADLLAHLDAALHRAAPAEVLLSEERVSALMEEALTEAQAGLDKGEIPIGSIVARGDGSVAARGHNRRRATGRRTAHAEMEALAALDEQEEGPFILVTTLEPCVMCLGAAMEAGFDAVVYALSAPPNGGTERCAPPSNGFLPRLVKGVRAEASRALLAEWAEDHPESDFVRALLSEESEA